MRRTKRKLHNVQEKTCGQLHSVQCEGMNYNATELAEKLRKMEKSDEVTYRQQDAALSARVRLEKLETTYRTAINQTLEDLENAGVRL